MINAFCLGKKHFLFYEIEKQSVLWYNLHIELKGGKVDIIAKLQIALKECSDATKIGARLCTSKNCIALVMVYRV